MGLKYWLVNKIKNVFDYIKPRGLQYLIDNLECEKTNCWLPLSCAVCVWLVWPGDWQLPYLCTPGSGLHHCFSEPGRQCGILAQRRKHWKRFESVYWRLEGSRLFVCVTKARGWQAVTLHTMGVDLIMENLSSLVEEMETKHLRATKEDPFSAISSVFLSVSFYLKKILLVCQCLLTRFNCAVLQNIWELTTKLCSFGLQQLRKFC